jgi:hypothetical protein
VYIRIYLPDALGRWAKDHGVNLSATLRAEVERIRAEEEEAEQIERGVYRAGDAVLIEPAAAGVELSEERVRIPMEALRRWAGGS